MSAITLAIPSATAHYFDDVTFAIPTNLRVLPGQTTPFLVPSRLSSVDQVKDNLTENIGRLEAEVGLDLAGMPKVTLGYAYHSRTGNQSLGFRGLTYSMGGGEPALYPLWQDIEYTSHRFWALFSHRVGDFEITLRPEYEIFEGEREYTDRTFAGDRPPTFLLNERRVENQYDSRSFNGRLRIQGELIKDQLHMDTSWNYLNRDNDNNVDALGIARAGTKFDEKALSYLDNTHNSGDYQNRFDFTLTYVGWDIAQPWVGFQWRGGNQNNRASRFEDGSNQVDVNGNPALPDEQWNFRTANEEYGWAESFGLEFRGLDKTKIIAKGEFEQIDVDYDWSADFVPLVGSIPDLGNWRWEDTGHFNRYVASLQFNNKSFDDITLSGRYRYTVRMTNHDEDVDLAEDKPGDADYQPHTSFVSTNPLYTTANTTSFYYPGTIGDTDLVSHDAHLKVEWSACDWLTVAPRAQFQHDEYHRAADVVGEIGTMNRWVLGLETTATPVDGLVFKNDYHFTDASTWTRAHSFTNTLLLVSEGGTYRGGLTPRATSDSQVLDSSLSYTIDELTLRTTYQYATSNFLIHTYRHFGTVGAEYRATDQVTIEGTFGYVQYWEEQNAGINDYDGPMGSLSLKARF